MLTTVASRSRASISGIVTLTGESRTGEAVHQARLLPWQPLRLGVDVAGPGAVSEYFEIGKRRAVPPVLRVKDLTFWPTGNRYSRPGSRGSAWSGRPRGGMVDR
jgi:hypothetical protein